MALDTIEVFIDRAVSNSQQIGKKFTENWKCFTASFCCEMTVQFIAESLSLRQSNAEGILFIPNLGVEEAFQVRTPDKNRLCV